MTPEPPIPAECDIAGMPFMPFESGRFFKSELFNTVQPIEGWAAFILWNRAWERDPPASLPDDDAQLARMCNYTGPMWRKAKAGALRNWVKCSDGLLYHPVVAQKALIAWLERIAFRKRSAAGNAAKAKAVFDPTPFDALSADAQGRLDRLLGKAKPTILQGSPQGNLEGHQQGHLEGAQGKGEGTRTYPGGGDPPDVGDDPLGGGPRLLVVKGGAP